MRSVFFRSEFHETSPSATDIEHRLSRFEAELAADEIELRFLRLVEVFRIFPITAGVGHPFIEHPLEKVVPDIVMFLPDLKSLSFLREIADERGDKARYLPA